MKSLTTPWANLAGNKAYLRLILISDTWFMCGHKISFQLVLLNIIFTLKLAKGSHARGYQDYLGFLCTTPGIDSREIRNYTNSPCNYTIGHPSNLNSPSITISHLVKTRTVTRTVTNVAKKETYVITARMAPAMSIHTNPSAITLRPGASKKFSVTLTVRSVTGSYSFGEVLLKGSRGHKVRIPVVAMGYDR